MEGASSRSLYEPFTDDQGLINEFALVWNLKDSFPLHFTVFKQTAVHIPHEANVEQVFSTSGILSDPHMSSRNLSNFHHGRTQQNRNIFKPPWQLPLRRYCQKFSKAGKLEWEEATLGLEVAEEEQ